MVSIFWHNVTYFAYAHYYLLSVYLLQDEQTVSHSWQDVRNSWAFCWRLSSSWGHLWSFQLSWHISLIFSLFICDGEHLNLTYAHYIFSLFILQDAQTVSHSWQDVRQSQVFCWCSSPLADDVSGHVNSPGISHLYFHNSSMVVSI